MLRKHELRSVVNETVLEWLDANDVEVTENATKALVEILVENIQEVWFN